MKTSREILVIAHSRRINNCWASYEYLKAGWARTQTNEFGLNSIIIFLSMQMMVKLRPLGKFDTNSFQTFKHAFKFFHRVTKIIIFKIFIF